MESAGGNPLFVDANPEISEASWAFPCQEALEKASRRWKLFCSLDARVTPRNGRNSRREMKGGCHMNGWWSTLCHKERGIKLK
jgi:hypothetical protein